MVRPSPVSSNNTMYAWAPLFHLHWKSASCSCYRWAFLLQFCGQCGPQSHESTLVNEESLHQIWRSLFWLMARLLTLGGWYSHGLRTVWTLWTCATPVWFTHNPPNCRAVVQLLRPMVCRSVNAATRGISSLSFGPRTPSAMAQAYTTFCRVTVVVPESANWKPITGCILGALDCSVTAPVNVVWKQTGVVPGQL